MFWCPAVFIRWQQCVDMWEFGYIHMCLGVLVLWFSGVLTSCCFCVILFWCPAVLLRNMNTLVAPSADKW